MAEQHMDLIDRQALLAKKTEMELCFAVSEYDIASAPRVNAVEVVRCKDCRHFVTPQGVLCCDNFFGLGFPHPSGDDFCSYGERRDGE